MSSRVSSPGRSRCLWELRLLPEGAPLEIGGLNSFASAPFLEVHDREGGIEKVRAVLSKAANDIGCDSFTPHVTIGLYSGAFESKTVMNRISGFSHEPIRLSVDFVTFAAYDATKMAGALVYKKQVALGR